ncbi:MAG: HAMP domain-containing histidine kinase [Tannerellaceae bacterium]|jgi:two-component system phosphate regulon sensor histidine kinase PhoR|nr:HAMP domain-containing histidine kinase [Tannerellaceae bacterium]
MEKRMRFVWALSLLSALLVIGVQAYWLYNQYRYVVQAYSGELAVKIWQAGDREYEVREAEMKSSYTYVVNKSAKLQRSDSLSSRSRQVAFAMYLGVDSLQQLDVPKIISGDSAVLNLRWDANMAEDSLQSGIHRAVANLNNPFRKERLDSILSTVMPEVEYTIIDRPETDTTSHAASRWEKAGHIWQPRIRVSYAYSPLEGKSVWVDVKIPSQPVFRKMAVQLALAFGLVCILTGCLVFQVKTILRQKKLGELRESFVNTMIHELKRPVQTLKTFVAFLGNKEMCSDEAASGQVVQDAMFELDNLSAYLNKLKDMLHADNDATPLHITSFDLQELTARVIRLTPLPAGKKVSFSVVYDMGSSPSVEADPVHIANILDNLVENAIKYSGPEVAIEVRAFRKGRDFLLVVDDDGIGIPPAEQERVFDKFYRASNLPDKQIPGLGLGLSYVKLITEAHRGTVSLAGRSGGGTSVTLCFPQ